MPKLKGKFWPYVRPLIWEKAQQLYQEEQEKTMDSDFKGITATRQELREGGYFHRAKIIVLRNLYRQKKGLPTVEEEELIGQYGAEYLRCYSKSTSSGRSEKDEKHKPEEPASVNTESDAATRSVITGLENHKAISTEDIKKEGFNNLEDFRRAWIEINGSWNPKQIVTVYEFKSVRR